MAAAAAAAAAAGGDRNYSNGYNNGAGAGNNDDDDDDDDDEAVVNAWFGPGHTVSPLHHDPCHNLLAQVVGSKHIRIFHPKYSARLYPSPGLLRNTSLVDVERPDAEAHPAFMGTPCWECVLEEGEMLYIPPFFWHWVKAREVSFSVSFWWNRQSPFPS